MQNTELSYTLRLKDMFSKTMGGAMKQTKSMDNEMGKLKNTIAGAFALGTVVSFGKAVVASLKNYESFHASLKVLLYGNIGAANALEKQLISLAKQTPFSLTDVQEGSKQLLAYSFAAGEIVDNMKMLGDISSGVKKPLGELVYLYGTLKTQGRAFSKDIYQFTTAGINILPQLAKQFKTTDSRVMKLVEDGKVGFKNVEQAFKDMTSAGGQFFGMMKEQTNTVGGQLSMLDDSWEQLKVKIGQSQTGLIASTTRWSNNLVESLNRGKDAMNLLEKAFKGTKSSEYSFMEEYVVGFLGKSAALLGMKPTSGGYAEMQQYASGMQQNLGSTSKDKLSALTNNFTLSKIMRNISADSKMSDIEKNRRVGILQEIRKQNMEAIGLFALKGNASQIPKLDENGNAVGGRSRSLGSGSEVTGQRPQSLTINIGKLNESFNVNTTNLTEAAPKVKEMMTKVLLEAVNDVNLMATQ